jgi:hypothetical protein
MPTLRAAAPNTRHRAASGRQYAAGAKGWMHEVCPEDEPSLVAQGRVDPGASDRAPRPHMGFQPVTPIRDTSDAEGIILAHPDHAAALVRAECKRA